MKKSGPRLRLGATLIVVVIAAALFAVEPNLLAHGSLVTTDMGMAAFYFLTAFFY